MALRSGCDDPPTHQAIAPKSRYGISARHVILDMFSRLPAFIRTTERRSAAILFWVVVTLAAVVGLSAAALQIGHLVFVRSQLQVVADSAALAAARCLPHAPHGVLQAASRVVSNGSSTPPLAVLTDQIELGFWDARLRKFLPRPEGANAVRVRIRRRADTTDKGSSFFAQTWDKLGVSPSAEAVAAVMPRDIAFVVDVSESMNDETEPAWAAQVLNHLFPPDGQSCVGDELMQRVFEDFGFGSYPGVLEHIGQPWGVSPDEDAYAELLKEDGPLSQPSIAGAYRIQPGDNLVTRKKKVYSAIIDYQIARLMPNAKPTPDSRLNYAYWQKYLDYVIFSPTHGMPDAHVSTMHNPNRDAFPSAAKELPLKYANKVGYLTYVQFMMDYGRDLRPDGINYVPLSRQSPYCPFHKEETPAGDFLFPPREEPLHSVRRALIAVLHFLMERNATLPAEDQDWVSIIAFDTPRGGGVDIVQPLTPNLAQAMLACTHLQACGDKGPATNLEAGLLAAREHLRSAAQGRSPRRHAQKVVILLTDGLPNAAVSSSQESLTFASSSLQEVGVADCGAAQAAGLMQAVRIRQDGWAFFAIEVGAGANRAFIERLNGSHSLTKQSETVINTHPLTREDAIVKALKLVIDRRPVRIVK